MQLEDLKKLKNEFEDTSFLDDPLHQQAEKDFKYLCTQTDYSTLDSLKGYITVKTADSQNKNLGEYLVVGHEVKNKIVKFPISLVDVEKPDNYIAVVCYDNKKVLDVLVFDVANFKKTGVMSKFKIYKKTNEYGIVLNDINNQKLKQYSFGYVLKNLK